jgi:tetratricopeptide (TPR) repeat protein
MKLTVIVTVVIAYFFTQINAYKEAEKLYNNKRYKESIEICTKEINKLNLKDSLFTKFISLRENSYRELNDYSSGISDCLILIKIHPTEISYYLELSYLYGSKGDYNNCFTALDEGLKIDSGDIYLLNNYSYYSNEVNEFENGIIFADKGLALTTDPYWKGALLNNKGYANIGLKKYQIALSEINEAISLNPDNSFAYYYRAIANIKLRHFETVCSDLDKAKSLGAVTITADLIKQYCHN